MRKKSKQNKVDEPKGEEKNAASRNSGQVFKKLREEHGVSQRELAKRLCMKRPRLRKIEVSDWRKTSVGEFIGIATALQTYPEDLMKRLFSFVQGDVPVKRSSWDQPAEIKKIAEGAELRGLGHWPKQRSSFSILQIEPQKSAGGDWIEKETIFAMFIIKGQVTLDAGGRSLVFKEKDFLYPGSYALKDFYNPDRLRPVSALIFITPR